MQLKIGSIRRVINYENNFIANFLRPAGNVLKHLHANKNAYIHKTKQNELSCCIKNHNKFPAYVNL